MPATRLTISSVVSALLQLYEYEPVPPVTVMSISPSEPRSSCVTTYEMLMASGSVRTKLSFISQLLASDTTTE